VKTHNGPHVRPAARKFEDAETTEAIADRRQSALDRHPAVRVASRAMRRHVTAASPDLFITGPAMAPSSLRSVQYLPPPYMSVASAR